MLDSIPLSFDECKEILRRDIKLDPGFADFHAWCKSVDIPVVIVSRFVILVSVGDMEQGGGMRLTFCPDIRDILPLSTLSCTTWINYTIVPVECHRGSVLFSPT
ncbi:hypothetical protein FRC18_002380 [Serendipita sp. 400]|nr:hypothetical protein FRC18_002380 [Serendipita sp. 400]